MDCKILKIQETDGLITAARYLCAIGAIETEGWWYFNEPQMKIPYAEITENDVVGWVKKETGKMIETNLNRQTNQPLKSIAPWLPQTFTPSI